MRNQRPSFMRSAIATAISSSFICTSAFATPINFGVKHWGAMNEKNREIITYEELAEDPDNPHEYIYGSKEVSDTYRKMHQYEGIIQSQKIVGRGQAPLSASIVTKDSDSGENAASFNVAIRKGKVTVLSANYDFEKHEVSFSAHPKVFDSFHEIAKLDPGKLTEPNSRMVTPNGLETMLKTVLPDSGELGEVGDDQLKIFTTGKITVPEDGLPPFLRNHPKIDRAIRGDTNAAIAAIGNAILDDANFAHDDAVDVYEDGTSNALERLLRNQPGYEIGIGEMGEASALPEIDDSIPIFFIESEGDQPLINLLSYQPEALDFIDKYKSSQLSNTPADYKLDKNTLKQIRTGANSKQIALLSSMATHFDRQSEVRPDDVERLKTYVEIELLSDARLRGPGGAKTSVDISTAEQEQTRLQVGQTAVNNIIRGKFCSNAYLQNFVNSEKFKEAVRLYIVEDNHSTIHQKPLSDFIVNQVKRYGNELKRFESSETVDDTNKDQKDKVKQNDEELKKIEKLYKEKENELAKAMEAKEEELNKYKKNAEVLSKQMKGLKEEKTSIENQLARLKLKQVKYQEQTSKANKDIDDLKTRKEVLDKALKQKEMNIQALQKQIEEASEQSKVDIKKLETQLEEQTNKVTELEDGIAGLRKEDAQRRQEIANKDQKIEELKKLHKESGSAEVAKQLMTVMKEKEGIDAERVRVESELKEKLTLIQTLTDQKTAAEADAEKLSQQLDSVRTNNQVLERRHAIEIQRASGLERELDQANSDYEQLLRAYEQLQQKVDPAASEYYNKHHGQQFNDPDLFLQRPVVETVFNQLKDLELPEGFSDEQSLQALKLLTFYNPNGIREPAPAAPTEIAEAVEPDGKTDESVSKPEASESKPDVSESKPEISEAAETSESISPSSPQDSSTASDKDASKDDMAKPETQPPVSVATEEAAPPLTTYDKQKLYIQTLAAFQDEYFSSNLAPKDSLDNYIIKPNSQRALSQKLIHELGVREQNIKQIMTLMGQVDCHALSRYVEEGERDYLPRHVIEGLKPIHLSQAKSALDYHHFDEQYEQYIRHKEGYLYGYKIDEGLDQWLKNERVLSPQILEQLPDNIELDNSADEKYQLLKWLASGTDNKMGIKGLTQFMNSAYIVLTKYNPDDVMAAITALENNDPVTLQDASPDVLKSLTILKEQKAFFEEIQTSIAKSDNVRNMDDADSDSSSENNDNNGGEGETLEAMRVYMQDRVTQKEIRMVQSGFTAEEVINSRKLMQYYPDLYRESYLRQLGGDLDDLTEASRFLIANSPDSDSTYDARTYAKYVRRQRILDGLQQTIAEVRIPDSVPEDETETKPSSVKPEVESPLPSTSAAETTDVEPDSSKPGSVSTLPADEKDVSAHLKDAAIKADLEESDSDTASDSGSETGYNADSEAASDQSPKNYHDDLQETLRNLQKSETVKDIKSNLEHWEQSPLVKGAKQVYDDLDELAKIHPIPATTKPEPKSEKTMDSYDEFTQLRKTTGILKDEQASDDAKAQKALFKQKDPKAFLQKGEVYTKKYVTKAVKNVDSAMKRLEELYRQPTELTEDEGKDAAKSINTMLSNKKALKGYFDTDDKGKETVVNLLSEALKIQGAEAKDETSEGETVGDKLRTFMKSEPVSSKQQFIEKRRKIPELVAAVSNDMKAQQEAEQAIIKAAEKTATTIRTHLVNLKQFKGKDKTSKALSEVPGMKTLVDQDLIKKDTPLDDVLKHTREFMGDDDSAVAKAARATAQHLQQNEAFDEHRKAINDEKYDPEDGEFLDKSYLQQHKESIRKFWNARYAAVSTFSRQPNIVDSFEDLTDENGYPVPEKLKVAGKELFAQKQSILETTATYEETQQNPVLASESILTSHKNPGSETMGNVVEALQPDTAAQQLLRDPNLVQAFVKHIGNKELELTLKDRIQKRSTDTSGLPEEFNDEELHSVLVILQTGKDPVTGETVLTSQDQQSVLNALTDEEAVIRMSRTKDLEGKSRLARQYLPSVSEDVGDLKNLGLGTGKGRLMSVLAKLISVGVDIPEVGDRAPRYVIDELLLTALAEDKITQAESGRMSKVLSGNYEEIDTSAEQLSEIVSMHPIKRDFIFKTLSMQYDAIDPDKENVRVGANDYAGATVSMYVAYTNLGKDNDKQALFRQGLVHHLNPVNEGKAFPEQDALDEAAQQSLDARKIKLAAKALSLELREPNDNAADQTEYANRLADLLIFDCNHANLADDSALAKQFPTLYGQFTKAQHIYKDKHYQKVFGKKTIDALRPLGITTKNLAWVIYRNRLNFVLDSCAYEEHCDSAVAMIVDVLNGGDSFLHKAGFTSDGEFLSDTFALFGQTMLDSYDKHLAPVLGERDNWVQRFVRPAAQAVQLPVEMGEVKTVMGFGDHAISWAEARNIFVGYTLISILADYTKGGHYNAMMIEPWMPLAQSIASYFDENVHRYTDQSQPGETYYTDWVKSVHAGWYRLNTPSRFAQALRPGGDWALNSMQFYIYSKAFTPIAPAVLSSNPVTAAAIVPVAWQSTKEFWYDWPLNDLKSAQYGLMKAAEWMDGSEAESAKPGSYVQKVKALPEWSLSSEKSTFVEGKASPVTLAVTDSIKSGAESLNTFMQYSGLDKLPNLYYRTYDDQDKPSFQEQMRKDTIVSTFFEHVADGTAWLLSKTPFPSMTRGLVNGFTHWITGTTDEDREQGVKKRIAKKQRKERVKPISKQDRAPVKARKPRMS